MAAKYASEMSSERRLTLTFLIVGTVLAIASVFGPLWLVRLGVGIAVLGSAAAVWYAFREMSRLEVLHRKELKAVRLYAREAAQAHHVEQTEMINTFTERHKAHREMVSSLTGELADSKTELSTLRGNLVSARAQSDAGLERVTELEALIAQQTAELEAARLEVARLAAAADVQADAEASEKDAEGDLVTLPRRVVSRRAMAAELPTAEELWSDGDHPTIVDLASINFPESFELRREA